MPDMGLIPAWAGKTMRITLNSPSLTAHPRMGGENCELFGDYLSVAGSSPHGRGKPGRTDLQRH